MQPSPDETSENKGAHRKKEWKQTIKKKNVTNELVKQNKNNFEQINTNQTQKKQKQNEFKTPKKNKFEENKIKKWTKKKQNEKKQNQQTPKGDKGW